MRRRLFALVFGVGLVAFLFSKARDPRNYQWLAPPPEVANSERVALADPRPIDTVLAKAGMGEEEPGVFTSPAPLGPPPPPDQRYLPGVRRDFLADVRDDDVFRSREHDAFFHLLSLAAKTDDRELAAASLGTLSFAQLFRQPETYRGRVVTIRGAVRRVEVPPVPHNKYGIEKYFQVWIQPQDNPTYPIVAYVLKLPPGFPADTDAREEVELTGFFYKRWAYQARDEIRTAPMVLGRTFRWIPAAAAPPPEVHAATIVALAAGMSVLIVIALVFALTRSKVSAARQQLAAMHAAEGPALDRLKDVDLAPSPADMLREMTERAHEAAPPPAGHPAAGGHSS